MVSDKQPVHQMVSTAYFPTNSAHIWNCPTCGHVVATAVINGKAKRLVLEQGDPTVAHQGGVGGLQMGGVKVFQADNDEEIVGDEHGLSPELLSALSHLDFGDDSELPDGVPG